MTICTFVDPDDEERDRALYLAIAIAEHSVSENRPLFLLCDPITALEIGLALLGTRTSRTVEGGEYYASPIVLLPFLRGRRTLESTLIELPEDDEHGGGLDEVFHLGVFAQHDEHDTFWLPSDEPTEVFEKIIVQTPGIVVGLGSKSTLWQAVYTASSASGPRADQRIVDIEGFTPPLSAALSMVKVSRNENAYVRRDYSDADEQTLAIEDARQNEEQRGALVAALFEFLNSSLDRPTPSAF